MTTRTLRALGVLAAGVMLSGPARAALYDRGGGLIYDSVLNVTWLQSANYAQTDLSRSGRIANIIADVGSVAGHTLVTSDFNASTGRMTWWGAMAWAQDLEYYDSVRKVTHTDWRLPVAGPVNGRAFNYSPGYNGWTDAGYNVSAPGSAYPGATGSELPYMYYNTLGNRARYSPRGDYQAGWSPIANAYFTDATNGSTSSFEHLASDLYWSGTEYAPDPSTAWYFNTVDGYQGNLDKYNLGYGFYAWAVRSGDVPLPGAGLLLASALLGLGAARRKAAA